MLCTNTIHIPTGKTIKYVPFVSLSVPPKLNKKRKMLKITAPEAFFFISPTISVWKALSLIVWPLCGPLFIHRPNKSCPWRVLLPSIFYELHNKRYRLQSDWQFTSKSRHWDHRLCDWHFLCFCVCLFSERKSVIKRYRFVAFWGASR